MEKLIFHQHGHAASNTRLSPSAYYIEEDITPKVVRIYAGTAPSADATFDIYDDGVSIFDNPASQTLHRTTGEITIIEAGTSVTLGVGQNFEDAIERFNDTIIEKGSWISCDVIGTGNGKDFTVILEYESEE